ncbi:hypothetical protein Ataiwa_23600 [Algoriphagus taiwanensis]|uniref:Uncharacterized protein n=1 Tax=Algoriphagus taiwanensis TaxID=1445656 RepID=A0ABQ6Q3M9_9BACT|nr:hypothetical protein Ataiwa_23600 [Algoriphagus taiwanensis]
MKKNFGTSSSLLKQRLTLLLVMFLCFFVSSVEYLPTDAEQVRTEQNADNPDQTIISVALDAVVPFAVQVADTIFYLIYQIFSFELKLPTLQAVSASIPNSLVETLFERIISTKGP